jgi:hypothetical protein
MWFAQKGGASDKAFEDAGNTPVAGITTALRQIPSGRRGQRAVRPSSAGVGSRHSMAWEPMAHVRGSCRSRILELQGVCIGVGESGS